MPLPNFFLIGAPKCGTTALYHALRQHPDIYMSRLKEPGYFAYNGRQPERQPGRGGTYLHRARCWKPLDYLALYAEGEGFRARGDATPLYLRTPEAAQGIRAAVPAAQIVAILRQPAERAYSGYHFMVNNRIEYAATFAEALAEEPARIEQGWFSGLYHKQNGFYHAQLSHYYDLFPREQIRIYLYEDWNKAPEHMLRDLFMFLDVDSDFQPALRRSNVTQVPRNRRLNRLIHHPKLADLPGNTSALQPVRHALVSTLMRLDQAYNLTVPPPIDPKIRRALTDDYCEDITKLQTLIGRDLSHWLK